MSYERWCMSPLPNTLPEALEEIHSLRKRLHLSNQRWSRAAEKADHAQRSHSGAVKKLEKDHARQEAQWRSFCESAQKLTGSTDPAHWLDLLARVVP